MPRFSSHLSGSHILVTGGSRGIGRGIVEGYLAEGANVSYCSRHTTGDDFSDFEGVTDGARAVGSAVDIGDVPSIEAWVKQSAAEFGRIDAVVANAYPADRSPSLENWKENFQQGVIGLIALIEASIPHLEKQKGSIIVVSSLAGLELKSPLIAGPYPTMKRAQMSLSKDYMRKLAPLHIRINCILPGTIDTTNPALTAKGIESGFQRVMRTMPEQMAKHLQNIAMGEFGTLEDAANLAIFLASPLSKYITGSNITLDGGMSTML